MAGTDDAAGDFGTGAGGDISRNIDITAETTVLDYLKKKDLFKDEKIEFRFRLLRQLRDEH